MTRFFLSGQTTCALLLGAGLLLRAQAFLQTPQEPATQQAADSPRTRPAELFDERAIHARVVRQAPGRIVRTERVRGPAATRHEQTDSHPRKGTAHRLGRNRHSLKQGRCGSALAQSHAGSRCG